MVDKKMSNSDRTQAFSLFAFMRKQSAVLVVANKISCSSRKHLSCKYRLFLLGGVYK